MKHHAAQVGHLCHLFQLWCYVAGFCHALASVTMFLSMFSIYLCRYDSHVQLHNQLKSRLFQLAFD